MTTARLPKAEKTFLSEVLLALEETEEQRDIRLQKLFGFFDSSRKGYLDHRDVELGFKALSIPCQYKYVNDLLEVCDSNSDGRVDFSEFCRYMDNKELELYSIFKEIDVRHNGSIQPDELRSALLHSGIQISDDEFMHFVESVDKDKNGEITFKEWRDFLFLYPHKATITNIYQYWEKVYLVDIGEHAIIPEGISRHSHAAKYFIAGGVAGALSRTATAPLDRVKVLFQIKQGTQSFVPCALKIYKESGFSGFFRGNGINILKVAPESAIKFYAYETVKGLLVQFNGSGTKDDISGIERLFAGGTAGAIAQTTIYPMELIKTRLMTHDHASSLSKLSKEIWRQEGFRAFYRGLLPSLLGIVPYAGIDLAAYESLKNRSRQWLSNDREPGPLIHLGCGMVSGAVGATSVYPLQVIRTRLQADSSNRYKGMIHAIQTTWREEGIRAFYKGLLPSLFKVVPSASITYIAYEEMKKYLSI